MLSPGRLAAGLTLTALLFAGSQSTAQPIHGAGTPFAQTLYGDLAKAYAARNGVKVAYESLAPEEVLLRLRDDRIDFGTLGLPLSVQELQAKGLVQFPTAIGGLVVTVNVPGIVPGALRLNGPLLADVFLGRIKTWSDPAIVALNPGLGLPDNAIRVAHPAEPSGATFLFTSYLASQSPEWKRQVGAGFSVRWPTGLDRGDGDPLLSYVQTTIGAIAFADYADAAEHGVGKPKLQNRAGEFVAPNVASFQSGAASAPWESTPAFAVVLVDPPGPGSWPLTQSVFTVLPLAPRRPERTLDVLRFLQWSFGAGADIARTGGYVVLPPSLAALVENAWKRQIKTRSGEPVWTGS